MIKVCIYNNSNETIVHYPSAGKGIPHLLTLPLKESLSKPEQLSFIIPFNNPGYSLIEGLKTKVKVFDIRDNSIIFSGRALPIIDGMSSDGNFNKEVICEGTLAYLNDTHTRRWNYINQTPTQILTDILYQHNSKVDTSRQITLGTVQATQPITINTNFETSLNAIITKVRNVLGGDIRVREAEGVLYLDYLTEQGSNNGVEIKLGYNLKEILREYDPTDIVTRVIPLGYGEGINQLGIESVNSGVEYIQDATSVNKYGVIEGVATNKDIQNAATLKIWGQTVLGEKKQLKLSYRQTALDLSVLTGRENEKYELGDTIHTKVEVLNVDVLSRVIERERDLLSEPWNPRLTLSTRPITLTDQIVQLKQRNLTLENAPQGNTYIDTFGYAENIDLTHPFKLPVWLSPDIININRVRLHIDGQRYRAYEIGAENNIEIENGTAETSTEFPAGTGHNHYYGMVTYPHSHPMKYGIVEDAASIPSYCYVEINGVNVAGPFYGLFSQDIDITQYVSIPGQTYNIKISSAQNARVNAWVSIQAFIQTK
jgi:phage minor structural protein